MTRLCALVVVLVGVTSGLAWSSVTRNAAVIRAFRKAHPCPATGASTGPCPGWVVDHQIPLCLTGPQGDALFNLHWQASQTAKEKDRLEKALCRATPRPCP
jgi:hypothetical protein